MNYKKIIFYLLLIISIPIILGIGILLSLISFPLLALIFMGYVYIYDTYINQKKDKKDNDSPN
jgi:hypothetical protein